MIIHRAAQTILGARAKFLIGAPKSKQPPPTKIAYYSMQFWVCIPYYKAAFHAHFEANASITVSYLIFLAKSRSKESVINLVRRSCPIVDRRQFFTIASLLNDLSPEAADTGMLIKILRVMQICENML